MDKRITGYELSRQWFDWCFDNPEKISPNHSALYFFILEHCNRLGWKEKFGLPMEMTKNAIGIKNYRTYAKTYSDLLEWGFIKEIQKSKNQYSSCIIAIVKNTNTHTKALDKAIQKHSQKQCGSIVGIDKHITLEPITLKPVNGEFEKFWEMYGKKTDRKKTEIAFARIPKKDHEKLFEVLPEYINSTPEVKYRKNPLTWLHGRCWEDEVAEKTTGISLDML